MSAQPPEWAAKLLEGQARQGETLHGFGETIKNQSETLNGLSISQAKLETTVEYIKDQAKEDRETDRKTRVELEGKVGGVHIRQNESDKLRGEFDNHIDDDHASQASKNKEAIKAHAKDGHATISHEVKSDLAAHLIDNTRHSGEAPGTGGRLKTGATVGGGVAVGGGTLWVVSKIIELIQGAGG